MQAYDVYKDISERTGGDIYIGVVGPVRTGKSTFITKMMDALVIPRIQDENERARVVDELPQSGSGRTIMTTQPKFVPGEAINIKIDDNAELSVRMVDCVGYMIPGVLGQHEDGSPRMVTTPWFEHDIPFEQAAEIGTKKVIDEHASIGIVMTTDGTITEIPRENYVKAEERVVSELKALGKPFVIVLNSARPSSLETQALRDKLADKYGVTVALMNVLSLEKDDITSLLSDVLYEFPVKQVNYQVSAWLCSLGKEHWLLSDIMNKISEASGEVKHMKDFANLTLPFEEAEYIENIGIKDILLGQGKINVALDVDHSLFYQVLGEECGQEITDEKCLMSLVKELVFAKSQYDRLKAALSEVDNAGYGVVQPNIEDVMLEAPEMVQQGNRYGVRLKATAPSMHLIKVDVQTEVNPTVGTEQQTRDFIEHLQNEYEADPNLIWQTDIFGKSLYDMVREGLMQKMTGIPDEAREKLQEAMTRMVNEGSGGMLCILL